MIKVLALATYPVQAAATRFRVAQLVKPLRKRGISVELRSFLDRKTFDSIYSRANRGRTAAEILRSSLRSLTELARAEDFDVIFIQREAALVGPPVVEWTYHRRRGLPYVLDLDDATWVTYQSPTHGRLARILKAPSKVEWLIRNASIVTCGSQAIAGHAASLGARTLLVPTVVDLEEFRPARRDSTDRQLTVGWIGSHSTWQYLRPLLPTLAGVAATHGFRLLVVGHGSSPIDLPGVEVRCRPWKLESEARDFASLDIGLYPVVANSWSQGKSGLKAVQYMAAGVPFVASPVGEIVHMGRAGLTHLLASTPSEWNRCLLRLLTEGETRRQMGDAGRRWAVAHYGVERAADLLAEAIHTAASSKAPS